MKTSKHEHNPNTHYPNKQIISPKKQFSNLEQVSRAPLRVSASSTEPPRRLSHPQMQMATVTEAPSSADFSNRHEKVTRTRYSLAKMDSTTEIDPHVRNKLFIYRKLQYCS